MTDRDMNGRMTPDKVAEARELELFFRQRKVTLGFLSTYVGKSAGCVHSYLKGRWAMLPDVSRKLENLRRSIETYEPMAIALADAMEKHAAAQ
jgi:hypothetical protein